MTLPELLVALAVASAVGLVALPLALAGRRIYDSDQARTALNQDLSAAMDFVVTDVRQAGERLPSDLAALEIVDGGDSDELVVRRNLEPTVFRVCSDTDATDELILIAQTVSPVQGCAVVADDDSDGWPENMEPWRDARLAAGGTLRAYIYNPVTLHGEFFDYVAEEPAGFRIRAAAGTTWQFDYPVAEQCRLYLLEERRYALSGDVFQFVLNGEDATPRRVARGFERFEAEAILTDWSQQDSLGAGSAWTDVRSIHLELSATTTLGDRTIRRTFSNDVLPRNALSR